MTHEELLFKSITSGDTSTSNALRAVVELHKPRDFYGTQVCDGCDTKLNWQIDYPCSTIQAIEKELK